jgi:hypothetical protein
LSVSPERHHHEELAVLFADVVDGADVEVVELARRARLAKKAGLGGLVADQMLGEDLDRHRAPEPKVLRQVHLAHSTFAQKRAQLVVRQRAPWGRLGLLRL